jgi:hypothetical protein
MRYYPKKIKCNTKNVQVNIYGISCITTPDLNTKFYPLFDIKNATKLS